MIVASAIEHLRMAVAAALAALPQDKEGEAEPTPCEFCNDEGTVTTYTRWGEVTEDCDCRPTGPAAPNGQGEGA